MDHHQDGDAKTQATGFRSNNLDDDQPRALVTDGFGDLPPSYEASTGVGSTSSGPPPSHRPGHRSPRSSISSTHSHDGLLPRAAPETEHLAPEPQPSASAPPQGRSGSAEGYKKNDPMYWQERNDWDKLRGTPGCCGSSSGGCCFSSRGGCCFSDRGGCCFSDREGCCFSDRAGCCCGDLGGACCSDGR